jgi:diguanylate cyclase (GGDEF)-like protein/PAS domain S-box-containing protein
MHRISITYKLTLLLALLSTAPLIFLVFNRSNEDIQRQGQMRMTACEQLALSCSLHLRSQDYAAMEQLLDQFMKRTDGLGSVGLIRFDGLVIHIVGRAELLSDPSQELSSSHMVVPIVRGNQQWGQLEAVFTDNLAKTQLRTLLAAFLMTLSLNIVTFGMLLKRSLAVLDSGSAVPRRVRNTLDTIAGGVVILDPKDRVVMVNEAFQESCDTTIDKLLGKQLSVIDFRTEDPEFPWQRASRERLRVSGATLFLTSPTDGERCFVVNATPIFDAKDQLAGTLISFEDVTTLERQNQSLMQTLAELEISKEQIQKQNMRLHELASMDALTGVFNRRSIFEQLETCWDTSKESGLAVNCIMLDVDHFKKLNDNFGHAAGDQVLRDVSRTIKESVGDVGIVGRYGGEEFCIVLPSLTLEQAYEIGEMTRQAIATHLALPYAVTASFGVSSSEFGAATYQAMLEQADVALYAAKHGGRNAVKVWSSELESTEEPNLKIATEADQPISYHAVASLHAALAYRDADTALHSQRVAEMSVSLGRDLMTVSQLYVLEISALLHDIGKVGVPDSILLKPGKLDVEEWKVMEAHARMGVEIVESSFDSKPLSDIVRYHHYRYDGTNTPAGGPIGKDIPIGARIVCIVDAYDAMVSNRVYRKGRPSEAAFEELRRCAGTQFDPDLVERFIKMQVGWRPDSRHMQSDLEDRLAISIGHFTERTMTAFECHDAKALVDALERLGKIAKHYDMPAIHHLANALQVGVAESRDSDWEDITPILQDLLDMCLTVQRAHIRDVAARPQATENCPQSSYYATARAWWETDQV